MLSIRNILVGGNIIATLIIMALLGTVMSRE